MLQEISKITKLPYDAGNPAALALLRRIERKLPVEVNVDLLDRTFRKQVMAAAAVVEAEGPIVEEEQKPQGPRVLKIKSSIKGKRCEVPAPNGRRYAFGPKWNDSVKRGKGIALHDKEKLDHHARVVLGLKNPEKYTDLELCEMLSPKL